MKNRVSRGLVASLFMIASLVLAPAWLGAQEAGARPAELKAAFGVARWLESKAVKGPDGLSWVSDVDRPGPPNRALYNGVSGVALFFLEAYATTGEKRFSELAQEAGDYLLAGLDSPGPAADLGLYTGLAGVGFTLGELAKNGDVDRFRQGADRVRALILSRAREVDGGVEWNASTDLISGSAGIGLYLLDQAEPKEASRSVELAVRAGKALLQRGQPAAGGMKWAMSAGYSRLMPNFSHGTAGVGFFFARLYEVTGDKAWLAAAIAAGSYLENVAVHRGDSASLIQHHEPGGEELFYLGWCHGPPGTARLFRMLGRLCADERWIGFENRLAGALLASGIPVKRTPGFWVNHGVCCGTAGVADYFLDRSGEAVGDHRRFIAALRTDLLRHAKSDGDAMFWTHAEHRVRPDYLSTQTGLMQGAAGIGIVLLRFHSATRGLKTAIYLPDDPRRRPRDRVSTEKK